MTYEHKYKCLRCGLHFIIYSWDEKKGTPFCPECQSHGPSMHWLNETEKEIFEFVPGGSPLVGMRAAQSAVGGKAKP